MAVSKRGTHRGRKVGITRMHTAGAGSQSLSVSPWLATFFCTEHTCMPTLHSVLTLCLCPSGQEEEEEEREATGIDFR